MNDYEDSVSVVRRVGKHILDRTSHHGATANDQTSLDETSLGTFLPLKEIPASNDHADDSIYQPQHDNFKHCPIGSRQELPIKMGTIMRGLRE